MGTPATLPLQSIIDVTVLVSPQAPSPPQFNQAMILGESAVIPPWGGSNPRIREYTSLAGMLTDGFTTGEPEYIAAQIFFSQTPTPQSIWIGRKDATGTSILTAVPHTGVLGTGYVVGDLLAITGGGGSNGIVQVLSIGASGALATVGIVQDGTGYTAGTETTSAITGSGSGGEVDITVGNEGTVQALQYCRNASNVWYAFYLATGSGSTAAVIEAVAAWAETAMPLVTFFYDTSDVAVISSSTLDVCSNLKALNYTRSIGMYATNQGGNFPNNVYAGAALMGVAMGLNTGLANSFFTLKFKQLVGIATEPLSTTQVVDAEGKNCNLYLSYANAYEITEQGTMAGGRFFDEILNLDVLVADIQFSLMTEFVDNPSIPQTDPGEALLIHTVNAAAGRAVQRGFLAPATWEGVKIINLAPGDPVPNGYLAQAYSYSTQSTANRQARQAMPIYLAICEAGAVHFLTIGVYVQR